MAARQPRQRKTPKQRAEETLAAAQRRYDRLRKERTRIGKQLDAVQDELAAATARLDYARKDPALDQANTTTTSSTGGTTA